MSPIWEIGDADLADLAARQQVVAVVAGLGRQVEGDGKAGLSLGEVLAIELVRLARRRMAGVGAEDPGLVAASPPSCVGPSACAMLIRWERWPAGVASPAPKNCAEHNAEKMR